MKQPSTWQAHEPDWRDEDVRSVASQIVTTRVKRAVNNSIEGRTIVTSCTGSRRAVNVGRSYVRELASTMAAMPSGSGQVS